MKSHSYLGKKICKLERNSSESSQMDFTLKYDSETYCVLERTYFL